MKNANKKINSGVHSINGFTLQKNMALYILLEKYETTFKGKNYFICLEHHDDFLFCFLNERNEAEKIEAYQSKKNSPKIWKLDKNLHEIINKLLNTGKALTEDNIPKDEKYIHSLFFSSNQTIILEKQSIKEDNTLLHYYNLDNDTQKKIKDNIKDLLLADELKNLNFLWVDINRDAKKQEDLLVGILDRLFGERIANPRSAVQMLILLFQEIENTYNNGNKAKLLDESKRVASDKIEDTFNLLTSKSKCFNKWRKQTDNICKLLQVKTYERDSFESKFLSAFDLFKDMEQAEHRKILEFVKLNYKKCSTYTYEENTNELFSLFNSNLTTHFNEVDLKAILYAAINQVIDKN